MHQYLITFTDGTTDTVTLAEDLQPFPGEHQIRLWAKDQYPGREIARVALID
jgi:hypothetical protein